MNLGLFVLRLVMGGLFIGHGTQKLFGWFGGYGLDGTGGFFENLGYRPGKRHAAMAGLSEAGGGLLLVLGFLTPLAAAAIIGVMVNAMISVHAPKGVWNQDGGVELPLVYSTIAAMFAFAGPGTWSIDNAVGLDFFGIMWGLVTISVAVIVGVMVSGARREEEAVAETRSERHAA
jgi:putative oxidoreductase